MEASREAKRRAQALQKEGWGYYPEIWELGIRTRAERERRKRREAENLRLGLPLDFAPPF